MTKTQNKTKQKTLIVNSQVFTNRGTFVYTKKYFSITIRPFTESLQICARFDLVSQTVTARRTRSDSEE